MAFTILFGSKTRKQIEKLDYKMREKFEELFIELKDNPAPAKTRDFAVVEGSKHKTYRIRIGHYRVIYDVDWDTKEILVHSIERKKDRTYRF